MAILTCMLILPHQLILYHLICGSCHAPSPISSPMMDQAIWSWDALAMKNQMLLNWISRFNPPMHSIHVDHGIHPIFSRLMAAMHIFLRPPLPLLSLSPGYFPRTKGSGLPTPIFFFSITYDRYVPTPGPMSNIGLMIYAIFVRMDSRKPYAIRRGVKDTWFLLMLNWTLSHLVPHAG